MKPDIVTGSEPEKKENLDGVPLPALCEPNAQL